MLYNECLIAYDVEDNKERKNLFSALKDLGLRPIQKSVFWGKLTIAEERAVLRLFGEHIDGADRAFVVRASLRDKLDICAVGHNPSEFYDDGNHELL